MNEEIKKEARENDDNNYFIKPQYVRQYKIKVKRFVITKKLPKIF